MTRLDQAQQLLQQSVGPRRRVAIVGSGISGLAAAHLLHPRHDITVFEAAGWIGGHTHTAEVPDNGRLVPVDTGFIVYNEKHYPNFTRLLAQLAVRTGPSDMSFSVQREDTGLEYSSRGLNGLLAQRRNLLNPGFHRMVRGILRFYREAGELLDEAVDGPTLGEYLQRKQFAREFIDDHLVPVGAAVWSTSPEQMLDFPAASFVRFFHNHGFLQLTGGPSWRFVEGGSNRYVQALTAPFEDRIHLGQSVKRVSRGSGAVAIELASGRSERFDAVIMAVHSDTALRLLDDPSDAERGILGAISYQRNDVILHTQESLLPRRRRAWASWNYFIPAGEQGLPSVTYNMNRLQRIRSRRTYCVTLNRSSQVRDEAVIGQYVYDHPRFTREAVRAQRRKPEINGVRNTYYAGAYWGYGFHEDGVRSGLDAAETLARLEVERIGARAA